MGFFFKFVLFKIRKKKFLTDIVTLIMLNDVAVNASSGSNDNSTIIRKDEHPRFSKGDCKLEP